MVNNTITDLPFRAKTALELPKLSSKELQPNKWEDVFEDWSSAKNSLTFYRTSSNDYKCLFTEMGREEFLMLCILLNRHIELFNLFKLVLLDIEKMRETPCTQHDFTYKALDYIKLRKLKSLNLEI